MRGETNSSAHRGVSFQKNRNCRTCETHATTKANAIRAARASGVERGSEIMKNAKRMMAPERA